MATIKTKDLLQNYMKNNKMKLYYFIVILILTSCNFQGNGQIQSINTTDTIVGLNNTINRNLNISTNSPISQQAMNDHNRRIQLDNHLSIEMNRTYKNYEYTWTTILHNSKTNKNVILHRDTVFNEYKQDRVENPYDMYQLSGAHIDDKILYVLYDKFGVVTMSQYYFTSPDTFTEKSVNLSKRFVTPAMGRYFSNSYFKKIGNDVYISVVGGQAYSSGNVSELLKLYPDLKLKKITFPHKSRVICGFCIVESDVNWMKQEENQVEKYGAVLTKGEKKRIQIIKTNMNKEFVLFEMSTDEKRQREERRKIKHDGFSYYNFFKKNFYLDSNNRNTTEQYIKDVLSFCGQDSEIELLDAMYYPLTTYFFYQNQYKQVKIIRYINDGAYSMWHISDFDESDID